MWGAGGGRGVKAHSPDADTLTGGAGDLTDGFKAERVIGDWIDFYNTEWPHSGLAGRTPADAYGAGRPVDMMEKARALPTSPKAQQQQQNVVNKDLAA